MENEIEKSELEFLTKTEIQEVQKLYDSKLKRLLNRLDKLEKEKQVMKDQLKGYHDNAIILNNKILSEKNMVESFERLATSNELVINLISKSEIYTQEGGLIDTFVKLREQIKEAIIKPAIQPADFGPHLKTLGTDHNTINESIKELGMKITTAIMKDPANANFFKRLRFRKN